MFYVDTSVWVSSITHEAKSEDVRSWLTRFNSEELAISDWVVTEFSSALSLKVRTGQISLEQRAAALGTFSTAVHNSLKILPIETSHFRSAALFADNHLTRLRAGDALHLAVAADHGAIVCTLDAVMISAGALLGIETVAP